jgi:hypothetical protein
MIRCGPAGAMLSPENERDRLMWRLVVTARLKRGAHGPVSGILRDGPP